ncbi:MAG: hypothetical protein SV422_09315, partial [Pseudomonadota bacterium]|nr:hypothetical protein [Pseudomonadota bacterium]
MTQHGALARARRSSSFIASFIALHAAQVFIAAASKMCGVHQLECVRVNQCGPAFVCLWCDAMTR